VENLKNKETENPEGAKGLSVSASGLITPETNI